MAFVVLLAPWPDFIFPQWLRGFGG